MRQFGGWIVAAGLGLAACAPTEVPPDPGPVVPVEAEDTCGATPFARLIGQDATALERELILRQVRVIRPDMAVTMDYSEGRINFEVDDANLITRIFCG
jgi:hypothetical protein